MPEPVRKPSSLGILCHLRPRTPTVRPCPRRPRTLRVRHARPPDISRTRRRRRRRLPATGVTWLRLWVRRSTASMCSHPIRRRRRRRHRHRRRGHTHRTVRSLFLLYHQGLAILKLPPDISCRGIPVRSRRLHHRHCATPPVAIHHRILYPLRRVHRLLPPRRAILDRPLPATAVIPSPSHRTARPGTARPATARPATLGATGARPRHTEIETEANTREAPTDAGTSAIATFPLRGLVIAGIPRGTTSGNGRRRARSRSRSTPQFTFRHAFRHAFPSKATSTLRCSRTGRPPFPRSSRSRRMPWAFPWPTSTTMPRLSRLPTMRHASSPSMSRQTTGRNFARASARPSAGPLPRTIPYFGLMMAWNSKPFLAIPSSTRPIRQPSRRRQPCRSSFRPGSRSTGPPPPTQLEPGSRRPRKAAATSGKTVVRLTTSWMHAIFPSRANGGMRLGATSANPSVADFRRRLRGHQTDMAYQHRRTSHRLDPRRTTARLVSRRTATPTTNPPCLGATTGCPTGATTAVITALARRSRRARCRPTSVWRVATTNGSTARPNAWPENTRPGRDQGRGSPPDRRVAAAH